VRAVARTRLCLLYKSIQLETTIRMVVSLFVDSVKIRIPNVDLDLDIPIPGVDLVESIDKRSLFGVETTTNR